MSVSWLDILRDRVAALGAQGVAAEMTAAGQPISRTGVSLVVRGKYPTANTRPVEVKVMTVYGHIVCPFLERQISYAECREHHEADAPTSSQFEMRFWRACQGCRHNHLYRGGLE
jgi:hypothetical protein